MYLVRRSGCERRQENYKTMEDRKSCECYVSKKTQETNFKMKFFPLFCFSVFFQCLLFFIRTFDIIRTIKVAVYSYH